jgi:hypothetical protein
MQNLAWKIFAITLAILSGTPALAEDRVAVRGSKTEYDTRTKITVGEKPVTMILTGAALRKKVFFSVYTIASYLQEGIRIESAEELMNAECPKAFHLVMERDLEGKEIADAFVSAVKASQRDNTFDTELTALSDMLKAQPVKKGDQVWLTHVPKVGLHCDLVGKKQFLIQNPQFSRAIWGIYLGKNNLGDAIKRALISRL